MFPKNALKNFHYQTKQCLKKAGKKIQIEIKTRIKIDKSKSSFGQNMLAESL